MSDTPANDPAAAAAAPASDPASRAAVEKPAAKAPAAKVAGKTAGRTARSTRRGLRIVGPQQGFWRAGRHWGPEAVDVALDDLTRAQAEALLAEPRLTTAEIEMPVD